MTATRAEAICYVVALITAVLLMIPMAYFLFIFLSFGIGFFVLIGIGAFAVLGPIVALIQTALLRWLPLHLRSVRTTLNLWLCALIVHSGASVGFSRMGEVAHSMGGRNSTYAEAFLFPVAFVGSFLKEGLTGKPASDVSGEMAK